MILRRAAAVLLAVALTAGVAWLSRAPTEFGSGANAVIRLSWRVAGVPVEACRTRTEEELAALPVHMRSPRECSRALAPFALDVALDGRAVVRDTVFPKGARADRPVYVYRDLPVSPGRAALSVQFEAVLGHGVQPGDSTATRYAWDGELDLDAGDVALLTASGPGRLTLRTAKTR